MESEVNKDRRSYDQFCAVARALDHVGERWTLLLVRELLLGPRRFKDLLEGLPGIGTNLLTDRLRDLERDAILTRRVLPPPAGSTVYELTEVGRGLEPVVMALGRWGHQFLFPMKATDTIQAGWFMVSLRATFHPEAAAGLRATYELRIDGQPFEVRVDHAETRTRQGPAADPDVILTTDLETFRGLLRHRVSPGEAQGNGSVRVDGDEGSLQQFVDLFGWTPPGISASR